MTALDHRQIGDQILACYKTRQPIEPLTQTYPDMTVDDAYEIQLSQVHSRITVGEKVVGHKIGLTSAPMRMALGVDVPDYGHIFDTMIWPEDAEIPIGEFIAPRVEPEVAFVLEHDLEGPGVTAATAARAVAYCLPAIEIIDSRIRDWNITLPDTIADNGSSGGVVLAARPMRVTDVDLRLIGCVISQDGAIAESGVGVAVMGGPLKALAWLANSLAERGGLRSGSLIMSGSITAPLWVKSAGTFDVELDRLGRVSAHFTGGSDG